MEHEHNCQAAGTDTDNVRQGTGEDQSDSRNTQKASPGIKHSIRPGVPAPETVLVAVMTDGSYLLMGYPQREPAAFVARDDAGLLREALTAAFQSSVDEDSGANGRTENDTRTGAAVPGHESLRTERTQP